MPTLPQDILSTFGLVNALLLAVVMAIPGSVSFDDLTAANIRFGLGKNVDPAAVIDNINSTTPYPPYMSFSLSKSGHDWFARMLNPGPTIYDQFGSDDNFGYSNRLSFYIAGAVGALTSALLSTVLVFFFMAASDFHVHSSFQAWWHWARWLVLQQFIATGMGVALTYFCLMILMDVKFPDYCQLAGSIFGRAVSFSQSNKEYFDHAVALQPQCPHTYFFWSTILVLWCTIAVCVVILSVAATSRYYHERVDDKGACRHWKRRRRVKCR